MMDVRRRRTTVVAALLAVTLTLASGAALASGDEAATHELTQADLSAFIDGYLPVEMDRAAINGVSVAVVKDGQVLLARGYGTSDLEHHLPMSADTMMRVGSISKLFMWTAVMQLVEQQRLNLDVDVQQYVDFPLPRTFNKPITLRALMTHTAGFEDTVRGMWANAGEPLNLRDYLVHHVPARLWPPGTVVAYSNYGAALAGYIVQRVSGEPFVDYAQRRILDPLGMTHSTFVQPLPLTLAPLMSRGYLEGADPAKPFELIRIAPAGGMSASAADMARFMIANLVEGEGRDAANEPHVLRAETLAQMQAPQWRPQAQGPAFALGFWEDDAYSQRVIGHGGDSEWFHSGLYLLPAQHVGLYVAQNGLGRHVLRDQLMRRFMTRYFPAPPVVFPAGRPAASETDGLDGSYMSSRRNESGPLYLAALMGQSVVQVDEEGTLTVSGVKGLDDRPVKFRSLGRGVWQSPDDSTRKLFFGRDDAGRWQMGNHLPVEVAQRMLWTSDVRLIRGVLGAALVVTLSTLLGWPIAAIIRRHYAVLQPSEPRARRARRMLRMAAFLVLLPWMILLLPLQFADNGGEYVMAGPHVVGMLRATQVAAWVSLLAIPLSAICVIRAVSTAGLWWASRLQALLMFLVTLGAMFIAAESHLLIGTTSL